MRKQLTAWVEILKVVQVAVTNRGHLEADGFASQATMRTLADDCGAARLELEGAEVVKSLVSDVSIGSCRLRLHFLSAVSPWSGWNTED